MGQAKQRGTYEERVALAKIEKEAALALFMKERQEKEDNMTEQEKQQRKEARQIFVSMVNAGQLDNLKDLL